MRHAPGRESCRWDGEEMTVAKQTRYRFGETKRQMVQKTRGRKNELFKRTTLTTRTLSEMPGMIVYS